MKDWIIYCAQNNEKHGFLWAGIMKSLWKMPFSRTIREWTFIYKDSIGHTIRRGYINFWNLFHETKDLHFADFVRNPLRWRVTLLKSEAVIFNFPNHERLVKLKTSLVLWLICLYHKFFKFLSNFSGTR